MIIYHHVALMIFDKQLCIFFYLIAYFYTWFIIILVIKYAVISSFYNSCIKTWCPIANDEKLYFIPHYVRAKTSQTCVGLSTSQKWFIIVRLPYLMQYLNCYYFAFFAKFALRLHPEVFWDSKSTPLFWASDLPN